MPYEGLHASFCGNVPQWFCVAETAVEVITSGVQVYWILTPEAGDAVGDRQCAGSQRRPQWGSDRWRGAKKFQIVLLRTAFDEFLNVREFALVDEFSCQAWVQAVNTEHQYLVC